MIIATTQQMRLSIAFAKWAHKEGWIFSNDCYWINIVSGNNYPPSDDEAVFRYFLQDIEAGKVKA